MDFSGYKMKPSVPRWGSQVEWDDVTRMAFGAGAVVRNMRFQDQSIGTRFALVRAMLTGHTDDITGLGFLNYEGDSTGAGAAKYQFVYDLAGRLYKEFPAGSKTLVPVVSSLLAAGLYATFCPAYGRSYVAQSDLISGQAAPFVVDGKNGDVQRMSDLPLGTEWTANTAFVVGDIVAPTVSNGRIFRANAIAGNGKTGGVEPVWPTNAGTVVDNNVTWKECTPFFGIQEPTPATPILARVGAGGTYAAGRDVYIKTTWVNANGETALPDQTAAKLVNTVLNDGVQVTKPVTPSWNAASPFPLTGWRVYAADVATGAAAPADSVYHLIGATNAMATATLTVTTTGAGAAGPLSNTATLTGAGNVCSGQRWMVVLFENSNGYISGMTDAIPVSSTASQDGFKLYVAKIPVGRANTVRRICAFTIAGGVQAGPFFYIGLDDIITDTTSESSINVTKTTIEDNVTTTATFDFPDFYLETLPTEVSNCFNKAMVPSCADIYFSKALNRLILTGVPGYPSAHWVGAAGDPETFYLSDASTSSELEISERDGQRTVAWREVGTQQYSLKEDSGFLVDPTVDPNPEKWDAKRKWDGHGPCGPLAIDGMDSFFVYAHTSGAYFFNGQADGPAYLTPELEKTWARINQAAKHTMCVKIDQTAHEIHFLLPLDGATKPNYRVRLHVRDWQYLTGEPIVLARNGKFIVNTLGRRWTVEPLDCNVIDISKRDLTVSVDQRIDHRQVLYGRNSGNGMVSMERPDYYIDEAADGTGLYIDWQVDTVYADNPNGFDLWIGGGSVAAKGNSLLKFYAFGSKTDPVEITAKKDCDLTGGKEVVFHGGARSAHDEFWALRLTGDGTAGSWAQLHYATLHLNPKYATAKG